MNLVSKYKSISKLGKVCYNLEDISKLKDNEIEDLLKYFYKKKDFGNFVNLINNLSENRKCDLLQFIYNYVFKFKSSDKNYSYIITSSISNFLDVMDLKKILQKVYEDTEIKSKDVTEKNNLYLLACQSTREETKTLAVNFIKKISMYKDSTSELISYLEVLKNKNLIKNEHVSLVSKKVIEDKNIELKVRYIAKFGDWISRVDMTSLVNSIIITKDCSKMLYISTVIPSRDDLFIKLGYSICALGNAEYIYRFLNQHYERLLKDEIEYFKICLLQTKNDIWITYYALAHDKSIIKDYYGGTSNLLEKIRVSSNINSDSKQEINKLILQNTSVDYKNYFKE